MTSMEMKSEPPSLLDLPLSGVMPDQSCFPFGLRLELTKDDLERLDLDPSSAVAGGMVHLHAMARIKTVSYEDNTQDVSRVCLQIEDMCVESEDEENQEE